MASLRRILKDLLGKFYIFISQQRYAKDFAMLCEAIILSKLLSKQISKNVLNFNPKLDNLDARFSMFLSLYCLNLNKITFTL